jgi:hypothetical protein
VEKLRLQLDFWIDGGKLFIHSRQCVVCNEQ